MHEDLHSCLPHQDLSLAPICWSLTGQRWTYKDVLYLNFFPQYWHITCSPMPWKPRMCSFTAQLWLKMRLHMRHMRGFVPSHLAMCLCMPLWCMYCTLHLGHENICLPLYGKVMTEPCPERTLEEVTVNCCWYEGCTAALGTTREAGLLHVTWFQAGIRNKASLRKSVLLKNPKHKKPKLETIWNTKARYWSCQTNR